MEDIYVARLFKRHVQNLRKDAGLHPWNGIKIYYKGCEEIDRIIGEQKERLESEFKNDLVNEKLDNHNDYLIMWSGEIEKLQINIFIVKI